MNNKYKILFSSTDNYRTIKLNNGVYNLKEKNVNQNNRFSFTKLCAILLLIIIIKVQIFKIGKEYKNELLLVDSKKEINFRKENFSKEFWNKTFIKNEMHFYSLYNEFKFPFVSLIFMKNEGNECDLIQIINQIKNISYDNFTNFEIILYLQNGNKKEKNLIERELKKFKKDITLKIYNEKNNKGNDYPSSLINGIKGLFTIFMNNLNSLTDFKLGPIYNYTKGKVDNYFNFSLNDSKIYLIRTKMLKNLIDKGEEFNKFSNIISHIVSYPFPKFNYIHICLCPNNFYTNLAYASITSILSSKSSNTFICIYLIIPLDFDEKNIYFIDSLYELYEYFNITFITMDDRYDKAYTDHRISKQAYYRFSLGELLPNLNKIIYLDTDIIVYKDLSQFYNINFNGKMILGQPTYGNKKRQRKGFHRINTGVLLLNLAEMRKNEFEKIVIKIIKKGKKYRYHDQTLLNDNFKEVLGIFPPEYHTRPWSNYKEMNIFNNIIGKPYDMDYFYFAHKYPVLRHFLGKYKPRNHKINHIEDWWFFARKSKYYNKTATSFNNAFSF